MKEAGVKVEDSKARVKVEVKTEVNAEVKMAVKAEMKTNEKVEEKRKENVEDNMEKTETRVARKEFVTVPEARKIEAKGVVSNYVEVGTTNSKVKEESEVGVKAERVYVPTAIPDDLFDAPPVQAKQTTAQPNQMKQKTVNAPATQTNRTTAPTAATAATTQKKPTFVSEKARRKRAREDHAMIRVLGPLRKAEIRRLQELGTKEAREKIKTMRETDKRRHQLLESWKGTTYPERMEGMSKAEKTTYENYRAEYRQALALAEVEAAQKKIAQRKTPETKNAERQAAEKKTSEKKPAKRKTPDDNSEQPERPRKLTKRDHKERRRLPREDFIGDALLLARKIHDKRLEHTQRDGPYYLRSKGSPSRQAGGKEELVKIEDVMAGVGYAAWRMENDPEIFEEYDAAEVNLSPPPSPRTASKTYINFGYLKQGNVDDLYYDFWASK